MKDEKNNPFYEVEDVASVTECTGLMPVLPQNETQEENYAALYATHKSLSLHKDAKKK